MENNATAGSPSRRPLYKNLTVQVLVAIAIGATIGALKPKWGESLQPLADAFLRLVKMVVGPIIFLTIVVGISTMGDLKKVGRVGGKALLYFEVTTTAALAIGLLVANLLQPGAGIPPADASALPPDVAKYVEQAKSQSMVDILLHVIPDNVVGAFANNDLLQILFFAVLFGIAVSSMGEKAHWLVPKMEQLTEILFKIVGFVMKVAPLGALGAMAVTVGKYGIGSMLPLAKLMGCVYLTMGIFIFVVLGAVCRAFGFSLLKYLAFIKDEILLVLGTSSSESALPRMIEKMHKIGCPRAVVGMVIPAGYSFNLDGTSIYLSMAMLFMAQAFHVPLTLGEQISILLILMLTSKGAAAVTGAGFVTLAATITTTKIPVAGLALLLGVDRFMSEARAITNLIGNGVATIVVSKMEGQFDQVKYEAAVKKGGAAAEAAPALGA